VVCPIVYPYPFSCCVGPVGLGDGVGQTNISLAKRLADAAGRILSPDRAVQAVDATFIPVSRPRGLVGFLPLTRDGDCSVHRPCSPALHQTHTTLNVTVAGNVRLLTWYYFVSIHLGTFEPSSLDMYPPPEILTFLMRESRWQHCANGSQPAETCLQAVDIAQAQGQLPDLSSGSSRLGSEGQDAWRLFQLSPRITVGEGSWTVLGEPTMVVPVSRQRFVSMTVTATCVGWTLHADTDYGDADGLALVTPANVYVNVLFQHTCQARVCRYCVS